MDRDPEVDVIGGPKAKVWVEKLGITKNYQMSR